MPRSIGCHLKPVKVIGSTGMTLKEQKFYKDQRKFKRYDRHHEKVLIRKDGVEAHKKMVGYLLFFFVPGIYLFQNLWQR